MLGREHRAGTSEAGLHFVGDEKNAVPLAGLLQNREEFARRRDETAFAKHGFDDDGGDSFGRHHALESILEVMRAENIACGILQRIRATIAVGIRDAVNVRGKGFEAGFVRMRFAGQRHSQHRSAMKRVFEADDRRTPRIGAGDFHGVFDGFGAAVHENRLSWRTRRGRANSVFPRAQYIFRRGDAEAGMDECVELFANGRNHARRAMARIHDADASGEVEEAIAVHVFEHGAFGARGKNRRRVPNAARHGCLPTAHQFLRLRAGYRSTKLNRGHISTTRWAAR